MTTNGDALTFYELRTAGALWLSLPAEEPEQAAWLWTPGPWPTLPLDLDTHNALIAAGWQRTPEAALSQMQTRIFHLWGQLCDARLVAQPGKSANESEVWAPAHDLELVEQHPVALAFTLPSHLQPQARRLGSNTDGLRELGIAQAIPPATLGAVGLVFTTSSDSAERGWRRIEVTDLPPAAQQRQRELGIALEELTAGADWPPLTEVLAVCVAGNYARAKRDLESQLLDTRGAAREQVRAALAELEEAHTSQLALTRAHGAFSRDAWLERWKAAQQMSQQLADDYWKAGQEWRTAGRAQSLPPLTSAHRTLIPSHNAMRGVMQSFGPAMQRSLWNLDAGARYIELQTPNNSRIQVKPEAEPEVAALHRIVQEALTPEGAKHMLGLLAAYADQTGGGDQRKDARVSLRQLLLHMGKQESEADDLDEQRAVYETAVYLSRSWVTASDKPETPTKPGRGGRKGRVYRDYSPLLVIERVQIEHDGSLKIPREIAFHLGEDYHKLLFGSARNFFAVPTPLLMSYHADRDRLEVMLALYLSDLLTWNRTPWRVSFRNLALQAALRNEDSMAHDQNRLRDALRILLALEHLERDELIVRSAHPEADMALACVLATGDVKQEQLSKATHARIAEHPLLKRLHAENKATLSTRRRKALQDLLNDNAATLAFAPGRLLIEQAEKRAEKRAEAEREAIEREERVAKAREKWQAMQRRDAERMGIQIPVRRGRGRPRKNSGKDAK